MSRWVVVVIVALMALLLFPLAGRLLGKGKSGRVHVGITTPLHLAAAEDSKEKVEKLLDGGADPKAVDECGKTPLHVAAEHGQGPICTVLIQRGADANAVDVLGKRALDYGLANRHEATAAAIFPFTTPADDPGAPSGIENKSQGLDPKLRYPDVASFEAAIGQPACLVKSEHVYLFAPKYREEAANTVLPYLTKGYDALYAIVGMHTQYIIVVYNFPPGHHDAFGGTSECTLWYDDTNLDLARQEEWTRYKIPHVSGYIEEMAHNFVAATHAQFGWEMVGWSIGAAASATVAANPIAAETVQAARQDQTETYRRYREQGCTFPSEIKPNQVDRVHAHILWECEQQYGPDFWKDFFKEARKAQGDFLSASGDRDRRYQVTVECFNRLAGLNFKQRLADNQISLTRDIKSLKPTERGWNRKLQ